MDPFPAELGSTDPARGSPVSLYLEIAESTVTPISKHSPVLLRYPKSRQLQYRFIWSRRSKPCRSTRLVARHKAIEVSSVQSPGRRSNGPPPTMSSIGSNESRERNSRVVPTASPEASPTKQPRNRSRSGAQRNFVCRITINRRRLIRRGCRIIPHARVLLLGKFALLLSNSLRTLFGASSASVGYEVRDIVSGGRARPRSTVGAGRRGFVRRTGQGR